MQRNDCPNQTAQINNQELVVRRRRKAPRRLLVVQVWQQRKRILQLVRDLMVGRQSTRFAGGFGCAFEVRTDLSEAGAETAQTGKLGTDTGGKRSGRTIFDITE